jgi:phosphatidylethanolamine-binding protein (PEBP) family uncharacterized protein/fibronectin type 3 domain-containing protein
MQMIKIGLRTLQLLYCLLLSVGVQADTALYTPSANASAEAPYLRSMLTLPSVQVGNTVYAVGLDISDLDPLAFVLTSIYGEGKSQSTSAEFSNGVLSIPEIKVNNDLYGATFRWQESSNPAAFVIDELSLKCSNCAESRGVQDTLSLLSAAFGEGEVIPDAFTCRGDGSSLSVTWTPGPAATQAYALIMDSPHPEAPGAETYVNWNLFNIPLTVTSLLAGTAPPAGTVIGISSGSQSGYDGPCASAGEYAYRLRIYALSTLLSTPASPLTRAQFEESYAAQILESSNLLSGNYHFSPQGACTASQLENCTTQNSCIALIGYWNPVTNSCFSTPQLLGPPTNISGSEGTSIDRIAINWDPVEGASGYNVYVANSYFSGYSLSQMVTSNSAELTGLDQGTARYFKIATLLNDQEGQVSGIYSGYTYAVLSAPQSVTASLGSYPEKITLNWNPVSGATGYNVYSATSANGTYTLAMSVTENTADYGPLSEGVERYFKIAATTEHFEGGFSEVVQGATTALLEIPSGVTATDGTYNDRIKINWTQIPAAGRYNVYASSSRYGTYSLIASVTAANALYDNLPTSTSYYFRVSAIHGTEESNQSTPVMGSTSQ